MPQVDTFEMVALLLSPFLLLLGWLLARPERAPYGVGAALAFRGWRGWTLPMTAISRVSPIRRRHRWWARCWRA
jgi:hypothetical protein